MADIVEYEASDATARWDDLLLAIERGSTVRIVRDGKTIARTVPEAEVRSAEAIERIKALSKTFGKAPLDEILASRHEGHKH